MKDKLVVLLAFLLVSSVAACVDDDIAEPSLGTWIHLDQPIVSDAGSDG